MAAVTGTFTASGNSATFTASEAKSEVIVDGGDGSIVLEVSRSGATVWHPVDNFRPGTRVIFDTPDANLYRLRCSWVSGTIAYRVGP